MPNLHFQIIPVRSTLDIEATTQLFKAYAASLEMDLTHQGFAQELATMPGKYAPPHGELLLARDTNGKPLGCVALRPLQAEGYCEIKRLYVSPEGRGLGLGQALVDSIIQEAIRIGYREICLDTLPSMTQAIGLYQKVGFLPIEPYNDAPIEGTLFFGRRLQMVN